MPKLKTKQSAKKRFSYTKNGKIKRRMAFCKRKLSKKSRRQKRVLSSVNLVHSSDLARVKEMMPYSS